MANFGFPRLSIVAPFAQNWMEAKSAVGAPDLLRDAKVYTTLAEAIAHCTLVLGTGSLDRRRPEQTILTLPEAAAQVRCALATYSEGAPGLATGVPNDRSSSLGWSETWDSSSPHKGSKAYIALVFGSEAAGLDPAWVARCDRRLTIPMRPGAESLNVAVAAGIILYHFTR